MACLVSISFSTLLRPRQTLLKKICLKNSGPGGLSYETSVKTAINPLAPSSSNGGIFSVSQSSHSYLTASLNHFGEFVSCCLGVSFCTHVVITGYWVGPDIDDGWGFVEAFVNRIT